MTRGVLPAVRSRTVRPEIYQGGGSRLGDIYSKLRMALCVKPLFGARGGKPSRHSVYE